MGWCKMEKVELTQEDAKQMYVNLASEHLESLKELAKNYSAKVQQIISATDGKMIPNLSGACLAALSDALMFTDKIIKGEEELLPPPAPIEVPEEFKAQKISGYSVTIKVPQASEGRMFSKWIREELVASVSELWGDSKHDITISGQSKEDGSLECLSFSHKNAPTEIITAKEGDTITFRRTDSPDWIKVTI